MSSYKKDYYENACIYMWKNKLNGQTYIGQTVNEKKSDMMRMLDH